MPLLIPCVDPNQWEPWPSDFRLNECEDADASLYNVMMGSPSLIEISLKLAKSETIQVPSSGSKVLFVREGEIALNVDPAFDYIGSDDATTCHILLVRNHSTNEVSVAHVDSEARCQDLKDILYYLAAKSDYLEVYCLGGLLDCDLSSAITSRLIGEMQASSAVCRLRALCTQRFNIDASRSSRGRPYPAAFGLGIHNGEVTAMHFPIGSRGPNYIARRCTTYQSTSSLAIMYDGRQTGKFCIHRCVVNLVDAAVVRRVLPLGDEAFLRATSTSPHCEPAHFCAEYRETLRICSDEESLKSCFLGSDGEPRAVLEYEMSNEGKWMLV